MTEDETFIRAILDDPADDTPRLVYADWLDDHDDPRGPYLRAEAEWARAWWVGEIPSAVAAGEWRDAAAGLDPVWLMRLTRPPFGVCCSHLGLTGDGRRLTEEELAAVEEKVHNPLPAAYRAFLLNHNHALADARLRGRHPDTARTMAFRFFPVEPAKVSGGGSYSREFGWWNCPNSGREACVQIGLYGKSGNCLLMVGVDPASHEDRLGQVWYYTLRPDRRWRLSETLPAFLATLRAE